MRYEMRYEIWYEIWNEIWDELDVSFWVTPDISLQEPLISNTSFIRNPVLWTKFTVMGLKILFWLYRLIRNEMYYLISNHNQRYLYIYTHAESVCVNICLSIYTSIYLSIYVCVHGHLTVFQDIWLGVLIIVMIRRLDALGGLFHP